jgi:hypothetical protein
MTGLSGNQASGAMSIIISSAVFAGTGFNTARRRLAEAMAAMPGPLGAFPLLTASVMSHLIRSSGLRSPLLSGLRHNTTVTSPRGSLLALRGLDPLPDICAGLPH